MKLEIKKAGINGEGIGFYKRKPVFVEGCFPDEIVECELTDCGRHYEGKLSRVLKKSPYRIKPVCPHFRKCGGCTLMTLEYEEQLRIKKQLLEGALFKYADYKDPVDDIVESPKLYKYRNKCNLPVVMHDGRLCNALYKQGSNHPAIIDNCLIHDERVEEIRKEILGILNKHKYPVYIHKEKTGIRQIVVRGFENEYQAVLITGKDEIGKEIISDLKQIKGLCSICQGINIHKNPVQLMPEKLRLLSGKKKITMKTGDYKLCLSPQAFFQLNHDQAERIYSDVSSLIKDRKKLIVEAYCGIGAISMYLHDRADKLIGIEVIDRAIEDARENAKLNGFDNLEFICDDASKAIRRLVKKQKIDVLIVDPPRTGLDDELLTTLLKTSVKEVIYVSCNPSTLGKDLGILKNRYKIETIKGYDMFPHTPLVEAVVYLTNKKDK
ncbi:MAG: 23S rRNA (uracil(1939)-C(5))-methyltransferase RlmD [Erysipelotrichaceae bacterium]|nr:23S rRNA (uracil(1939)-C(5))-methyltransferase RlmD [Erysipelotrichaceae bacterium]